jgi:hypothetical protein
LGECGLRGEQALRFLARRRAGLALRLWCRLAGAGSVGVVALARRF